MTKLKHIIRTTCFLFALNFAVLFPTPSNQPISHDAMVCQAANYGAVQAKASKVADSLKQKWGSSAKDRKKWSKKAQKKWNKLQKSIAKKYKKAKKQGKRSLKKFQKWQKQQEKDFWIWFAKQTNQ